MIGSTKRGSCHLHSPYELQDGAYERDWECRRYGDQGMSLDYG